MSYIGSVAKGAAAGYVVGSFISDPRKTSRRLVALACIAVAFVVMLVSTVVPVFNSAGQNNGVVDGSAARSLAAIGFICVLIIAIGGAKFTTPVPFSVFKLPMHLIASFRTSVATIVLWATLAVLSILTFLVVLNPFGRFWLELLLLILGFIAGSSAMNAMRKVQKGGTEVQDGVARALGQAPQNVQLTWSGKLTSPSYVVTLPVVLQTDQLGVFLQHLSQALPAHRVLESDQTHVVLTK